MACSAGIQVDSVIIIVNYPRQRESHGTVFTSVLSVCFPHDVSKTDAARIAKLHIEMFQNESWKPIYFGVKRSSAKVTSHKNAGVGVCTLVSVGFF